MRRRDLARRRRGAGRVQARTYSAGVPEQFGRQRVVEAAADVEAPEPLQGEAGVVGLPGQRGQGRPGARGRGGRQAGRGPARRTSRWGAAEARPARGRLRGRGRGRGPPSCPAGRSGRSGRCSGPSSRRGRGGRCAGRGSRRRRRRRRAPGTGRGRRTRCRGCRAARRRRLAANVEPRARQPPPRRRMLQEVAAEQRAAETARQGIAEVDRPARPGPGHRLVIRQVLEEAVGVRVVQRAVLAEVLPVVAALHRVVGQVVAVGGEEQVAVGVEGQAEQVAAALAEQLEPSRQRVEPPDGLLELDPADGVARRAAGDAVEPAVRPPGEVIGQRLGVLHAEAGEQDLGVAVGHVVAVAVGVEQQVGRLEDVDAAVAERQARCRGSSPVTKSLKRSARPSPSVSSQMVIRSAPLGPFGGGSGTRS